MSHLDGVTWLAVCVSRCHMLSSPSPVCRGIGASRAARRGSTTKSRRAHACPVTRPALPVQVRAQVKGRGVRKRMKNSRAHDAELFSVRLCVLHLFFKNMFAPASLRHQVQVSKNAIAVQKATWWRSGGVCPPAVPASTPQSQTQR